MIFTEDINAFRRTDMKKRRSANILTILVFVLVLLIPTYIAIISFNKTENAPPEVNAATKLVINDINGTEFVFDENDNEGKEMIDLLSSIIKSSSRADSLPVSNGTPYYLVSFTVGSDEQVYKFYFSKNSDSYLEDKDAKVYRIATEKAAKFLDTPYAASLFTNASTPVLLFNGTEKVLPESMLWKFRVSEGGLVAMDPKSIELATLTQSVDSDGSFDLNFSVVPNHTTVKITDINGKDIYEGAFIDGDLSALASRLQIKENTKLIVTLNAEWIESADLDYCGNAAYTFNVDFSAPAVFTLGEGTITRGGVVMLTAKNAKDPAKITFTSNPALTFGGKEITPTFYSNGNNSVALVMVDFLSEHSSYEFTVSYGAVTETLTLNVKTRTYRAGYTSDVSAAIANQSRSAAALAEFDGIIASLVDKSANVPLWDGKFGYSITAEPSYALGFGHIRTMTNTGEKYNNLGADYYVAEGKDIIAVQDGKVIYVGAGDFPGKFVVVDHGLGLFSAYLHLKEYTVSVGDTVEKGDKLGTAGTSGFIAVNGANHTIMYFQNGNAFCGYELEEKGIPAGN